MKKIKNKTEVTVKVVQKPEPVEIWWMDTEDYDPSWASQKDLEKFSKRICLIRSVGYTIAETKTHVCLAGDISDEVGENDEAHGRITKIPKKAISKIINLKNK